LEEQVGERPVAASLQIDLGEQVKLCVEAPNERVGLLCGNQPPAARAEPEGKLILQLLLTQSDAGCE
jgi:hypothetical protein